MSKDFKTYDQQMQHLNTVKNINCDSTMHRGVLVKNGYFNLVNGYKEPFITGKAASGNHIYISGVDIEDILTVKTFDDDLRNILFKYLSKVEEEIRVLIGYTFDYHNQKGGVSWEDVKAYDLVQNQILHVNNMIVSIQAEVAKSNNSYINHHNLQHGVLPTWVLLKSITFSNALQLLDKSCVNLKDSLCDLYDMKTSRGFSDYILLKGSLQWIRIIRNSCAHNERVFDITTNGRIQSQYIYLLPPSYQINRDRHKRLIDLFVYLRYYLCDAEYIGILDEVQILLADLKNKTNQNSYNHIRSRMGIKDASHLDILKKTSKTVEYSKYLI